ncbi:unnamed protein product [Mycena citricolor]|uniref:Uncharacterized protein n=1 Tax=Mycena citricolor TaxID=2018698 RepID=A0AAD2Q7F0_9AGAR|nr:unnamed protein product [Mycena citricolor]
MVYLNLLAAVLSALALVSNAAIVSGPNSAPDLSGVKIVTSLPAGATAFGSDNDTDWTVAYDKDLKALGRLKNDVFYALINPNTNSTHLAARQAALGGRCTGLSVGELQSLPAWPNLVQYVRDTLSSSVSYNLWTTWDGVTQATACVSEGIVSVERTGQAQCNTDEQTFDGDTVGRSGVVTLAVVSGSSTTATESVTRSATIGLSYTASVTVGIPGIGEASASYTASASFTNEFGKSFEKTISKESSRSVAVNSDPGDYCTMQIKTTTCYQPSRGRVGFVADGYVRFGFNSRVKDHYYWHIPISRESEDKRTSYMEFTGSINSHGYGRYRAECNNPTYFDKMRLSTLVSVVFALTGAHAKPISRRDFSLASYQDATPSERRDFLLAVNASNINLSQDTLDSLKTVPVVEKKMADSGTSELTNDWLIKWIAEFQDEVKQGQESGDADAGLSQVSKRQEEDCGDGEEQETKRGDDDEQAEETIAEKRDNDEGEGEARKRDEGDEEGEIFDKRDDDEATEDAGDAEATETTDEDTSESKRSKDDEEDADSDAVTKRQEAGDETPELEERDDEAED